MYVGTLPYWRKIRECGIKRTVWPRYGIELRIWPSATTLEWRSVNEPISAAQRSCIEALATEANEPVDNIDSLSKADAAILFEGLEFYLDDGVGFFLSFNSGGKPNGAFDSSNALCWSFSHKFADRYFPAPRAAAQPTTSTAKEHARMAAGEYRLSQRAEGDFREAAWLLSVYFSLDLNIRANEDGTIQTPGLWSFEDGRPQTWREVGPFVWREVGGDEDAQLNMKVENGKVVAFATSDVIAIFEAQRVPFWKSAALNVPSFVSAAIILIFSTLMWPVAALVRRHYGQALKLPSAEARSDRGAKIAALIAVIYMAAWILAMGGTSSVGFEPWIRAIQGIGLLCVVGAAVAVWNAWLTLQGERAWWAKAWSVLLALAMLELVWFSLSFHLLSVHLNY